jgi:hypothetical protein
MKRSRLASSFIAMALIAGLAAESNLYGTASEIAVTVDQASVWEILWLFGFDPTSA